MPGLPRHHAGEVRAYDSAFAVNGVAAGAFDSGAFGENFFSRRSIAAEEHFPITGELIVFGKSGYVIIERGLEGGIGAPGHRLNQIKLQFRREFFRQIILPSTG